MSNLDGKFVIFYVKNGKLYPVGLKKEQFELLQDLVKVFEPIAVYDKPQGTAENLKEV